MLSYRTKTLQMSLRNSREIFLDCQKGTNLITGALQGREVSPAGGGRDEAGGEARDTLSRRMV